MSTCVCEGQALKATGTVSDTLRSDRITRMSKVKSRRIERCTLCDGGSRIFQGVSNRKGTLSHYLAEHCMKNEENWTRGASKILLCRSETALSHG